MKTGFCHHGFCEGTKPRSAYGNPVKTCPFYLDCPCECHKIMNQIFEISGRERVLVENPEYRAPVSSFVMPTPDEILASRASRMRARTDGRIHSETPSNGNVAPIVTNFSPTPTGRKARGQLEQEVKSVCDEWPTCTPSFIAEQIDRDSPPSTGAISAVLERWERLGFARLSRKPFMFAGYTPEGLEKGLDVLKYERQRNRARDASQAARGYR